MASLSMVVIGSMPTSSASSQPPPLNVAPSRSLSMLVSASHLEPSSPTSILHKRSAFSRTLLALLASLSFQTAASLYHTAAAFPIGISGPRDWLKGQKKKTADYLLAPINASREKLSTANILAETASPSNVKEAQKLVKSAARDCIKPENGSFVAFQVKTGVEVCTFRLILKNAASLLDDADPVKLKANVALNNLISSFTSLDSILDSFTEDGRSDRNAVADAFGQANAALNNFEKGVRECLGIA